MLEIFFIISLLFCHSIEATSKDEFPFSLASSRASTFKKNPSPSFGDAFRQLLQLLDEDQLNQLLPQKSLFHQKMMSQRLSQPIQLLTLKLGGKVVHPDIKKTCDSTDYTPLCLTSIKPFQQALVAIPAGDVGTMNSMLSTTLADYGTCGDGFSGVKSPMSAHNDKLNKMSSSCLAIVSLIKIQVLLTKPIMCKYSAILGADF